MELKAVLGFVKFGAVSLLLSESGLALGLLLLTRQTTQGNRR